MFGDSSSRSTESSDSTLLAGIRLISSSLFASSIFKSIKFFAYYFLAIEPRWLISGINLEYMFLPPLLEILLVFKEFIRPSFFFSETTLIFRLFILLLIELKFKVRSCFLGTAWELYGPSYSWSFFSEPNSKSESLKLFPKTISSSEPEL